MLSCLYFNPFFCHLSKYVVFVRPKSFVLSKNDIKINASAIATYQQLWQHHELCIFYQFLLFSLTLETFAMPVTVRPDFVASWTDSVPVRNVFLHLRAVYKDTLFDPETYFPQLS